MDPRVQQYDFSKLTEEQMHGSFHLIVKIREYLDRHFPEDLPPMQTEKDGFLLEAIDQYADILEELQIPQ